MRALLFAGADEHESDFDHGSRCVEKRVRVTPLTMMVWCVDTRESDCDSPSLVVMKSVSYYSPFLAFVEKVRGLPLVHRCWKLEMPLADTATPVCMCKRATGAYLAGCVLGRQAPTQPQSKSLSITRVTRRDHPPP